jgi:hypothetical protein
MKPVAPRIPVSMRSDKDATRAPQFGTRGRRAMLPQSAVRRKMVNATW